jgi:hypothetical protein
MRRPSQPFTRTQSKGHRSSRSSQSPVSGSATTTTTHTATGTHVPTTNATTKKSSKDEQPRTRLKQSYRGKKALREGSAPARSPIPQWPSRWRASRVAPQPSGHARSRRGHSVAVWSSSSAAHKPTAPQPKGHATGRRGQRNVSCTRRTAAGPTRCGQPSHAHGRTHSSCSWVARALFFARCACVCVFGERARAF